MIFKKPEYRSQFNEQLRSDVRGVALYIDGYMYPYHAVVTAVAPELGVDRVSRSHAEYRAVDIRVNDMEYDCAQALADDANSRFKTGVNFEDGSDMLVCVHHGEGKNRHLHIQGAKGKTINEV